MTVAKVQIASAGYEQQRPAIQQIEFTVESGQLVGLIGPNGAGKSTTIKATMGLLKHMDGQIQIGGQRGIYAYIPEQPVYYEELTLWEHLELAGAAYDLEYSELQRKCDALLERFRLTEAKHRYPAAFSKGMLQKMMLIIAFLPEPDLYIVDEPFVGLDPRATKDFLDLLQEELQRGAGVLMSTHVLDTAEKICDAFLLINHGRLVAKGTLPEIREQCGRTDGSLFDCFHDLA